VSQTYFQCVLFSLTYRSIKHPPQRCYVWT
jgi:hypothetical protein